MDNLKLGYGGTATEMARLINDSGVLGDAMIDLGDKQNIGAALAEVGFAKMIEAIHVVQTEMGITGTTALEAGLTISGSVNAMKGAWENLVTGLADGNADISLLVDNLVKSIVGDGTENNLGVLGNIMPAVKRALNGASTLVQETLPIIVQEIPTIINENLPVLTKAAVSIVQALVDGISENQEMLTTTAFEIITFLGTSLISMLPKILQLGLDLIISLASGITQYLPEMSESLMDLVEYIVSVLTDEEILNDLLDAAIAILTALADLIVESLPELTEASNEIISKLVEFLTDPETLKELGDAAFEIVFELGKALAESAFQLSSSAGILLEVMQKSLEGANWKESGKNIVSSIWEGLKEMWGSLTKWFDDNINNIVGGFEDAVNTIKKLLGFDVEESSNTNNYSVSSTGVGYKTYSQSENYDRVAGVIINQNVYSQAQTAADLAQETQWEASRAWITQAAR